MAILVCAWIYFTVFFILARIKRDISFIDIGWGPAFSWLILTGAAISDAVKGEVQALVSILVVLWSLRLAWYLHGRNKLKGEDPRYTELAKDWKGNYWVNAYFRVFMVQMILCLIIAAPILLAIYSSPATLSVSTVVGAVIAIFGLVIETVADKQMGKFQKMKPRPAKFCRLGLWKYSRHPNYFGEIIFWFGVAFCVLSLPYGYLAMIGPVSLTFLLLKVSGVPMIENKYRTHHEWAKYEAETRLLIPLPKY